MPVVENAYCEESDLQLGDIAYPSYLGTKAARIQKAAEEIDIAIGSIYITPIEIVEPVTPALRPAYLLLRKVNWLIASGRIVLNMAAAGEQDNLHAFGHMMLKEGLTILTGIATGDIQLPGIPKIEPDPDQENYTGPRVYNEDPESLVEAFYKGRDPYFGAPLPTAYGHPRRFGVV